MTATVVTQIGAQVYLISIAIRYKLFLRKEKLNELYRRLLSSTAASPLEEETDPIGRYNIFVQYLYSSQESRIGRQTFCAAAYREKNLDAPWNEKYTRAVEDRGRSVRRFISHPNKNNFMEFRKARVSCTKCLAAQKRKA